MPKGHKHDDNLIKNIHEAIDFIEQTPEMTRQRDSYTRCLYLKNDFLFILLFPQPFYISYSELTKGPVAH